MSLELGLSLALLVLGVACLLVPGCESLAGICFIVGLIGLSASPRGAQA